MTPSFRACPTRVRHGLSVVCAVPYRGRDTRHAHTHDPQSLRHQISDTVGDEERARSFAAFPEASEGAGGVGIAASVGSAGADQSCPSSTSATALQTVGPNRPSTRIHLVRPSQSVDEFRSGKPCPSGFGSNSAAACESATGHQPVAIDRRARRNWVAYWQSLPLSPAEFCDAIRHAVNSHQRANGFAYTAGATEKPAFSASRFAQPLRARIEQLFKELTPTRLVDA